MAGSAMSGQVTYNGPLGGDDSACWSKPKPSLIKISPPDPTDNCGYVHEVGAKMTERQGKLMHHPQLSVEWCDVQTSIVRSCACLSLLGKPSPRKDLYLLCSWTAELLDRLRSRPVIKIAFSATLKLYVGNVAVCMRHCQKECYNLALCNRMMKPYTTLRRVQHGIGKIATMSIHGEHCCASSRHLRICAKHCI